LNGSLFVLENRSWYVVQPHRHASETPYTIAILMARETQKTLKITTNHVTVKKERWPIIPLGGGIGTDGQDQAQPSVSNDLHEPQQAKLVLEVVPQSNEIHHAYRKENHIIQK
jgi:hypothetical protein